MLAGLRPILFVMSFIAVIALLIWLPSPSSGEPTQHEITIDAAGFAYAPGRVQVNQGDQVVITLTASDVVHGFALDGYNINVRVLPGVSERIEFTAEKTGKFRFRCSVSCGTLHPFMIGELVVTPNSPFWKAAAIAVVALAGMLGHLWITERVSDA